MSNFSQVKLWMGRMGQRVRFQETSAIDLKEITLRETLMREELDELLEAMAAGDIVGIADGIADLLVVTYGTAACYGIDADAMFAEVMQSNFSKFDADGKPIYREDGKVLKGPNYVPPDIARVFEVGW